MDHLEVVKLMEQSGGKVWEDGHVSTRWSAVVNSLAQGVRRTHFRLMLSSTHTTQQTA